MTTPNTSVFDALNATFEMFETQVDFENRGDYRFEVRPGASIYIRKAEHRRGENRARINVIYIRNFPNEPELHTYINAHGIQTDHTGRDYLIEAEHIDTVIGIVLGTAR